MQKWAGYPPGTASTQNFEFDDTLTSAAEFCCAALFDRHIHEHLARRRVLFACAFIHAHTPAALTHTHTHRVLALHRALRAQHQRTRDRAWLATMRARGAFVHGAELESTSI